MRSLDNPWGHSLSKVLKLKREQALLEEAEGPNGYGRSGCVSSFTGEGLCGVKIATGRNAKSDLTKPDRMHAPLCVETYPEQSELAKIGRF